MQGARGRMSRLNSDKQETWHVTQHSETRAKKLTKFGRRARRKRDVVHVVVGNIGVRCLERALDLRCQVPQRLEPAPVWRSGFGG